MTDDAKAVDKNTDTPEPQAEPGPEATTASETATPPEPKGEQEQVPFSRFNLAPKLMQAIEALGFKHCTGIQAEALPKTLAGHDLIGQAQTGTGKTAAFLITAIQRMIEKPIAWDERYASEPRVLALAPTRELAMQIARDAEDLTRFTGHNVITTVGGMNFDAQRARIRNEAVDILVATPGRLLDFLNRRDVFLDQVDMLILDEADRMLDMGFIPDVKRIIRKCTPREERQTVLFSATFNQDVLNLSAMWSKAAEFIEIEPDQKTAERVEQIVYTVSDSDKLKVLYNALSKDEVTKSIVFANRRDQTRDVEEALRARGMKSALLSGEIAQNKRVKTLQDFKDGKINVLVATDVAGRGIHVEGVSHVFNYNLPDNAEDYVHRIGRTGRAGESGVSISLAGEDDSFTLPDIEKYLGQKLECLRPEDSLMAEIPAPAPGQRRSGGGANRSQRGGRPGRQGA